jgi:hypothetical protein
VEREDAVPVGARRKHHGAVRAPEASVARRPPVGSEHEGLRPTHRARARAHDPAEEERAFLVVFVAVRSRKPHVRRVPLRSVIVVVIFIVIAHGEVDDGAVVASLVIVAIGTTGTMVVHFRKEKKRGVSWFPSKYRLSFFFRQKKVFSFLFFFCVLLLFRFSFGSFVFGSFVFFSCFLFLFFFCSFDFPFLSWFSLLFVRLWSLPGFRPGSTNPFIPRKNIRLVSIKYTALMLLR